MIEHFHGTGRLTRLLLAAAFASCISVAAAGSDATDLHDWGFLSAVRDGPTGTVRRTAFGPFYESVVGTNGYRFIAVRPFYARTTDPATHREIRDYLWPLGVTSTVYEDFSWRFLLAFGMKSDRFDPSSRSRIWVLPFLFWGRDEMGRTYRAFFPFGGTIKELFDLDEIRFVMFPVWSWSKVNKLESTSWFWPFYARTKGPKEERFRIFPFYARARYAGAYEKRSICWPFWSEVRYYYPKSTGRSWILFPFYGRIDLTDQKGWWVLPPFIRYTRGAEMTKINAPWPIVSIVRGTIHQTWVWPFYMHRVRHNASTTYLPWPFVRWETVDRRDTMIKRFWILPFFYRMREWEVQPRTKEEITRILDAPASVFQGPAPVPVAGKPPVNSILKIWPLFSYSREGTQKQFRALDLWPTSRARAVDNLWAPLWTLYARRSDGDFSATEALWGLYRRERSEGYRYVSVFPFFSRERDDRPGADRAVRSWSVLKGLAACRSAGHSKEFRLLYFIRWKKDRPPDTERAP